MRVVQSQHRSSFSTRRPTIGAVSSHGATSIATLRMPGCGIHVRGATPALSAVPEKKVISLADLITFESDLAPPTPAAEATTTTDSSSSDPTLRAQAILSRASKALQAAREITRDDVAAPPSPSSSAAVSAVASAGPATAARTASTDSALDATRSVLRRSLEAAGPIKPAAPGPAPALDPAPIPSKPVVVRSRPSPTPQQRSSASSGVAPAEQPDWAASLFGPPPPSSMSSGRLPSGFGGGSSLSSLGPGSSSSSGSLPPFLRQQQQQQQQVRELGFAEPEMVKGELQLISQEAQDIASARKISLPPLQSVMELTTAFRPPVRQSELAENEVAVSAPTVNAQQLADGSGVLADGTKWEKKSGEEFGPDGYWKRWTLLSGASADGSVSWEEVWWEASDYKGLREMGAAKKGTSSDGSAWNEQWGEKMYHDMHTNERMVERTAHKWAKDAKADEWEEQWGEKYSEQGWANKYADKWARQAENVWHEKWGEDYDGQGGCQKYTDKWAERLIEGSAPEQWGDKWTETFKDGAGTKHGEVWSVGSGGERYNRYWNEEHFGNGHVRRYGNSNTGEYWDATEQMDTYYNPIPHFGYDLAVKHSPDLKNLPLLRPKTAKKAAKKAAAAAAAKSGGSGSGSDSDSDSDGLGGGMDVL